jgi:MraZ protein
MAGTYVHSLDEKSRVTIPAKLRDALTEHFWMTLDNNDNIVLYADAMWQRLLQHCQRKMADNPDNEALAAGVERIVAFADEVVVESASWRIPITEILRERAQLQKDVVTVGLIDHAVMWAREKYDAQKSGRLDHEAVRREQGVLLRAASTGQG